MVNRIWLEHFGTGLVDTPSNFGQTGERPSHPELLEYLASRFRDSGWSIKQLHREIMLSSITVVLLARPGCRGYGSSQPPILARQSPAPGE
jgi:hypothetical protein